jgi:hypothetical protein
LASKNHPKLMVTIKDFHSTKLPCIAIVDNWQGGFAKVLLDEKKDDSGIYMIDCRETLRYENY